MHSLLKTVNTTDTLTLFLEKSDRNRLGIRVENDEKRTRTEFLAKGWQCNATTFTGKFAKDRTVSPDANDSDIAMMKLLAATREYSRRAV